MTKNIKIQYSSRSTAHGYTNVPKIQMEGKWLEELGFHIGDSIVLYYEDGSIRIRALTSAEKAEQKRTELEASIKARKAELKRLQKETERKLSRLNFVAEGHPDYSAAI